MEMKVGTLGVKRAGLAGVLLLLLSIHEKLKFGILFEGYGSIGNAEKKKQEKHPPGGCPGWCVCCTGER